MPDLPKAKYTVWVRGYGLAGSAKVEAEPGNQLNRKAVPAANAAEAAKVYPAIYWYSMLKIPGADQFGGHSDIPDKVKQTDWLNAMKNNGCVGCHQLGNLSTRTLPKGLGEFKTSEEAWARRIQSGQAGPLMVNLIAGDLASTPIKYFAEWTDRIAEGELPKAKPQRPQGIERTVVITTWDWADDKHYLHDEISTDKRNPTVNGYGPLFGSPEYATDIIPILDPVKNSVTKFHAPVRLGRPAQHAGARQRRPGLDRQPQRRPDRLCRRQNDHDESALPDRLLRQRPRRPHRRPKDRLERPRPLDLERRPRALAPGRRPGHDADGGAFSDQAEPAGGLK